MLQGVGHTGDTARSLRKAMSPPEVILWRELRKRPGGFKFRRQHPSGAYIADFYCHEARLVIEVDGFAHDTGTQPERDRVRDGWFAARGIMTLRISGRDVLRNLDYVISHITETARQNSAEPKYPPLQGEVAAAVAADGGVSPSPDSATPLRLALKGNPPPLAGED